MGRSGDAYIFFWDDHLRFWRPPPGFGKVSSKEDTGDLFLRRIFLFALTLIVGATAFGLGFWQVGRLLKRRATNAVAIAGRALPPIVTDSGSAPPLASNRWARLTGELDPSHEFVIRNRLVRGVPAVQIITPLRLPGRDSAVLVNRGYVPAPDAVDPGSAKWGEPGQRPFRGVLLPMPDRGDGAPVSWHDKETWQSLDLTAMRARLPYPIVEVYLLAQIDSSEGSAHTLNGTVYPFRAEIPPTDEGPHLSYAIQWFGIGLAVLAFGVVFIWLGVGRAG